MFDDWVLPHRSELNFCSLTILFPLKTSLVLRECTVEYDHWCGSIHRAAAASCPRQRTVNNK